MGGFVVGTRVKIEGYNGQLPYWEVEYQLSGEVYKNSLIGIAVLKPQKPLKRPEIAVEVTQGDGSQFPRIIEQENSAL